MKHILLLAGAAPLFCLIIYSCVGTSARVAEIKKTAPWDIENNRGWEIVRYEGYQQGSWSSHGGKVWYHVRDKINPNIQYRVYVTLWGGELHYVYGAPEILDRVEIDYKTSVIRGHMGQPK